MNIILKTRDGYINADNGIKICREKTGATVFKMADALKQKEKIYKEKPMIGKITTEVIGR